jgi:outer membrane protein
MIISGFLLHRQQVLFSNGHRTNMPRFLTVTLLALGLTLCPIYSQVPLTLEQAVERARQHFPRVSVARSQLDAATAAIRLARTSYLPRLDSVAQVNRATRNNIYGMLMQQPVISPMSGPPVNENSATSVFGSAAGLLVEWEPFDFGLRKAAVEAEEAGSRRRQAAVARTEFEAASAAADTFLTVLAAQKTLEAAAAGVERNRVVLETIEALVRAELRPGADSALAKAELAAAQAQVIRSRQAVAEAKAVLAGLVGEEPGQLILVDVNVAPAPVPANAAGATESNPLAMEQRAVVDEARARLETVRKEWAPQILLQGTTYARGTGAKPDFTTLGGMNGLAPNYYNWGLGLTVTFPILGQAAVRARQAGQQATVRAEEHRYQEVLNELQTRRNRALAAVAAAQELAELTPIHLESARTLVSQSEARYRAGLTPVTEVADAQRMLTQAEIEDGLAKLNVLRAYLALHSAEGDLTPVLEMVRQ